MAPTKRPEFKERDVLVKDRDGKDYVCRADVLKNADGLTDEMLASCFEPPPPYE